MEMIEHTTDEDCICGPTVKPVQQDDGTIDWMICHHDLTPTNHGRQTDMTEEEDWDLMKGQFSGLRSVLSELTGKEGENEVRKKEKTSDLRFEQIVSDMNRSEWMMEESEDKDFWEDYWESNGRDIDQEIDNLMDENRALREILTDLLNKLERMTDEYKP